MTSCRFIGWLSLRLAWKSYYETQIRVESKDEWLKYMAVEREARSF